MAKTVNIQFLNSDKRISAPTGSNLLSALQKNKISIPAPCSGKGTCRKCNVKIFGKELLACEYTIHHDIILELPNVADPRIQSDSYFPTLDIHYDAFAPDSYGIAVDIGTTTIVVFLENLEQHENCDHQSFINPQAVYGADVISRIQYAQTADKVAQLHEILIEALNKEFTKLIQRNKLTTNKIKKITLTGNTTMLHLALGRQVTGMATYPFQPEFLDELSISANQLGLSACPEAELTCLPSISAFLGADISSGLAASELPNDDMNSLFIDIGTNGEIALGNKHRIIGAATAAGPAFEGAKISCGMGGVRGAIHQFSEEAFQTIGNETPTGLCGSGLLDLVATLLRKGTIPPDGYIENPIPFLPNSNLCLDPQDIREVQLAKAAIHAGIVTLLHKAELRIDQIQKVFLAGGFGYAMNPISAVEIGLIPKELLSKVVRVGNSAGLGARLALFSKDFRNQINKIAKETIAYDLSMDMRFNEEYILHMQFPTPLNYNTI